MIRELDIAYLFNKYGFVYLGRKEVGNILQYWWREINTDQTGYFPLRLHQKLEFEIEDWLEDAKRLFSK